MSVLEAGHELPNDAPVVNSSLLIDIASSENSNQPGQCRTFVEYANDIIPHFSTYNLWQIRLRVYVVFDIYYDDSHKGKP